MHDYLCFQCCYLLVEPSLHAHIRAVIYQETGDSFDNLYELIPISYASEEVYSPGTREFLVGQSQWAPLRSMLEKDHVHGVENASDIGPESGHVRTLYYLLQEVAFGAPG